MDLPELFAMSHIGHIVYNKGSNVFVFVNIEKGSTCIIDAFTNYLLF